MEENPIPIYVVEFMTDEWKTWTLFSLIFISVPLILARFLNRTQKIQVTYLIGVIMILDFITENGGYIMSGTWDVQYNLPIQLCGISSLICCVLPFVKKKDKLLSFDKLLLSIFRSAIFELVIKRKVSKKIIISEYLLISNRFFGDNEASLLNGVLDNLLEI